jgi:outer membrane biosynthesis protein TonB
MHGFEEPISPAADAAEPPAPEPAPLDVEAALAARLLALAAELQPKPEPPPVPVPPVREPPPAPTPPVRDLLSAPTPPAAAPTPIPETPPAAPPAAPMPEPQPAAEAQRRPQAFVGRLSRRLGDSPIARQRVRESEPAPAPVRAVAPSASPAMDRAERPAISRNRRLHRRVTLPAEFEIDGVPCSLIDVSLGGFAASGMPDIAANTVVPVALRLTIDGIEVGTRLNARVIYANASRSSGRFIELSPSQTAFLRYIVTWRGESVGAVGATTLLDTITGGPAGRPFPSASPDGPGEPPRERWWSGLIGRGTNPRR